MEQKQFTLPRGTSPPAWSLLCSSHAAALSPAARARRPHADPARGAVARRAADGALRVRTARGARAAPLLGIRGHRRLEPAAPRTRDGDAARRPPPRRARTAPAPTRPRPLGGPPARGAAREPPRSVRALAAGGRRRSRGRRISRAPPRARHGGARRTSRGPPSLGAGDLASLRDPRDRGPAGGSAAACSPVARRDGAAHATDRGALGLRAAQQRSRAAAEPARTQRALRQAVRASARAPRRDAHHPGPHQLLTGAARSRASSSRSRRWDMEAQAYEGALDRGLEGVLACTSRISTIHGTTLLYRGYTIEDLAAHAGFEEVVHLLWEGRLPSRRELDALAGELGQAAPLPPSSFGWFHGLPTKVHPMDFLHAVVAGLSLHDPDANIIEDKANRRKAIRLTARLGSIITAYHRVRIGQWPVQPDPSRSLAWNFLNGLHEGEPDPGKV